MSWYAFNNMRDDDPEKYVWSYRRVSGEYFTKLWKKVNGVGGVCVGYATRLKGNPPVSVLMSKIAGVTRVMEDSLDDDKRMRLALNLLRSYTGHLTCELKKRRR